MTKKRLTPKKINLVGKENMPQDGFPKLSAKDVSGSVNFKPFKKRKK